MQATLLKTNIIYWAYASLFHLHVQSLPAEAQEIIHKTLQTSLQPVPQLPASGNSLLIHGGSLGTWKRRGSSLSISSSPSIEGIKGSSFNEASWRGQEGKADFRLVTPQISCSSHKQKLFIQHIYQILNNIWCPRQTITFEKSWRLGNPQ